MRFGGRLLGRRNSSSRGADATGDAANGESQRYSSNNTALKLCIVIECQQRPLEGDEWGPSSFTSSEGNTIAALLDEISAPADGEWMSEWEISNTDEWTYANSVNEYVAGATCTDAAVRCRRWQRRYISLARTVEDNVTNNNTIDTAVNAALTAADAAKNASTLMANRTIHGTKMAAASTTAAATAAKDKAAAAALAAKDKANAAASAAKDKANAAALAAKAGTSKLALQAVARLKFGAKSSNANGSGKITAEDEVGTDGLPVGNPATGVNVEQLIDMQCDDVDDEEAIDQFDAETVPNSRHNSTQHLFGSQTSADSSEAAKSSAGAQYGEDGDKIELGFDEAEVGTDAGDFIPDNMSESSDMIFRDGMSEFGDGVSEAGGSQPRKRSFLGYAFGKRRSSTGDGADAKKRSFPVDPLWKVNDSTLLHLGKQLKVFEAEAKAEEEEELKEWRATQRVTLEEEIAALEQQCTIMTARIEEEVHLGLEHMAQMEVKLARRQQLLDEKKKTLYFPHGPKISLGQNGVYFCLDDFWLESASGAFQIELNPNRQSGEERNWPQVSLALTGTMENPQQGVAVRFSAMGFKLAGDKGKKVPKFTFENLTVKAALSLNMKIRFDMLRQKWVALGQDFQIKIISFRGPYGLSRSMVGMIVSFLSPTLRGLIAANLPHELGMLLHSLPTPFRVRGEFNIKGTDMNILSKPLHESSVIGQLSEYTADQLHMFYWLQKSMGRDSSSCLRCLADVIKYERAFNKDVKVMPNSTGTSITGSIGESGTTVDNKWWQSICHTWAEAARIYSEQVICAKMEQLMAEDSEGNMDAFRLTVQFDAILVAARNLMKKRMTSDFKLHYIDGQVSLTMIFIFIHQIRHRLASEELVKAKGAQLLRMEGLIKSIESQYILGTNVLTLISQNIDFANLTLEGIVRAGLDGKCIVSVSELMMQAPVLLQLRFLKEKNIGSLPLVPYLLSIIPLQNGDLRIEIKHFSHRIKLVQPDTAGDGSSDDGSADSTMKRENAFNVTLAIDDAAEGTNACLFSTSYNKVVKAITSKRAAVSEEQLLDLSFDIDSESFRSSPQNSPHPHNLCMEGGEMNTAATLSHAYGADSSLNHQLHASHLHIAVKQEHLRQALQDTLNRHPVGVQADNILVVIASNPHVSIIADKAASFQAGDELVTVSVGGNAEKYMTQQSNSGSTIDSNDNDTAAADATSRGCPIFVQTAPGIKMLTRVGEADIRLDLPGLLRFTLAHFNDVPLLKEYIETFVGGEFLVSQLSVLKVLLQKIAKYLLLPGLTLDLNINCRIVTLNGEIIVGLETPEFSAKGISSVTSDSHSTGLNAENLAAINAAAVTDAKVIKLQQSSGTGSVTERTGSMHRGDSNARHNSGEDGKAGIANCALALSLEFSLQELIDDIVEMNNYVQRLTLGTDTEAALGKSSADAASNASPNVDNGAK